jgi:FtsH-binding integral membrane protein
MNYTAEYAGRDVFAADAALDERVAFIRRVYAHLLGATLLFIGLCVFFVQTGVLMGPMMSMINRGQWWLLMIGFMGASWVAQSMAQSQASRATQYAGLGLYALVEAVIFSPFMTMLSMRPNGNELLMQAGTVTLAIFGGLTVIVMLTKADFSFLRNFLWVATIAATVFLFAGMFFGGFSVGLIFISAMVVLFSGWILYDTSNVLHHYPTNQHVAASLALFSSLATLFWWVLRLMSALNRD